MKKPKMSDLKRVSRLYERNFKKIMKSVGTEKHRIYTKREEKLDKIDTNLRKELGMYISNPCPLTSTSIYCNACVGRFSYTQRKTPGGKVVKITVQDKNGTKCKLKDIGGLNDDNG